MQIFKSFQVSLKELGDLFKNRFVRISLLAVSLVPLLYGVLYLWAFWDPYSYLKDLPVAVVNNDSGYVYAGKEYNFGNNLTDKIKSSDVLKWNFTNEEEANQGLKDKRYYLSIIIPQNFSENIMSASTGNPKQAQLDFKARESNNLLSAQITKNVAKEIVSELNKEIVSQYLKQVTGAVSSGSGSLIGGLGQLNSGSAKLVEGSSNLKTGLTSLSKGIGQMQQAAPQLTSGSKSIYEGVSQLTSSVASNSETTKKSIDQVSGLLSKINQSNLSATDKATLTASISGLNKVSVGIGQSLDQNSESSKNMAALVNGSKAVYEGSSSLESGINKASSASNQLSEGAGSLSKGTADLNAGASQLYSGVEKMSQTLSNEDDDYYNIVASPVVLKDVSIDKVPNYGTGFSPYFIPLALWVGSLILFLIIKVDETAYAGKKTSKRTIAFSKFITLSLFGTIQAIILDTVLLIFLGLQVKNLLLFYLFTILMSWCFIAIIQFLITCFGEAGKLLSIIFLMLQLTSSAGTFPLELVPNFFKIINPFLPMTYNVAGLREVISGGNWTTFGMQTLYTTLFMIGGIALTLISTRHMYKGQQVSLLDETLKKTSEEL